jgi:hypothetical protein
MATISNNRNGIALLMNKHRFNNTILMTMCIRFKVRCVFHRSHAGIMGLKSEKLVILALFLWLSCILSAQALSPV